MNEITEKKNAFSAVEDFTLLRWHSATQKRVERAKQKDQVDNKARLFGKSTVKTKHQSLTNLASMRLVPGANRVVRHICIRCIRLLMLHNDKICMHVLTHLSPVFFANVKPLDLTLKTANVKTSTEMVTWSCLPSKFYTCLSTFCAKRFALA